MNTVLITLHGGCFIGGNSSYDKDQTVSLKKIFEHVFQLDFKKTCLQETLDDLTNQISALKQKYKTKKFYVLGRSSGGYLAKILFDTGLFEKAFYLCPVFNPILRGQIIEHLGRKAEKYFENQTVYSTNKWNDKKEILYLATHDENVPTKCFTNEQLSHAIYIGPSTHAGMIGCTSKAFMDDLITYF